MKVLIVDRPRARSPLLNQFYRELCDQGVTIRITNRVNEDLETVTKGMFGGDLPDVIYGGFIPWDFINRNAETIKHYNIKVVIESMDNRTFGIQENCVGARDAPIAAIVTRSKMDYNCIEERIKTEPSLENAKIIYTPWASWPEEYAGLSWDKRDIDVAFLGSFYGKRAEYAMQVCHAAGEELRVCIGRLEYHDYRDILERTKLLIIMGVYNTFVQRYVEAGMSGCAVMGECPDEATDLLTGAMFKLPADEPNLKRAIRALMLNSDPKLVEETAATLQQRMREKRNLHFTVQQFLVDLEKVVG